MAAIEIRSRLVGLEDLSLLIHSPAGTPADSVSIDTYNVTVRCQIRLSEENSTISIIMAFDIKAKSDIRSSEEKERFAAITDKLPSLHYEGMATYEVGRTLALRPHPTTKGFSIPIAFINRLGDASYSTFRGIIFGKCGPTILRNVPLPLLDEHQIAAIISQVVQEV